MPPLSVILPAWNEEGRIAAGLDRVREFVHHAGLAVETVLVDDGSTDATVARAEAAAEGLTLRIVRAPHAGKGAALTAGVAAASGERLLLTDVDWSVSPREAARMLALDADLVVAVREGRGASRLAEPEWRHKLGRVFNWLVQGWVLSGHEDTQCGCKLLRRETARAIFPQLTVAGWAYDVELLYVAHLQGWRVAELPVAWRFESDSRVRPWPDGWQMIRDLRRIRRNAREGRYSPVAGGAAGADQT